MDNPNFIFLKEEYPKIYEICCMVDKTYTQSTNDFRYPVTFARMALEEILRRNLKIKKSEKKKLKDMIFEYMNKSHVSKQDEFYNDYLRFIWLKGNDAVHNNKIHVKVADKVIVRLQYVAHEILNIQDDIPNYQIPNGSEIWINEFNQKHPDFDEVKEYIFRMEEYALRMEQLDETVLELNEKIPTKKDIEKIILEIQSSSNQNQLKSIQTKVDNLQEDIPDNLKEDIANIKSLTDNISNYAELQIDLNNLSDVKDDYEFIKRDLESIKDKFNEVDDIKKEVIELGKFESNFDEISKLKKQLSEVESLIKNNSSDDLDYEIDNIDFTKINELSDKINDIRDNIASFTEPHLSSEQLEAVRSRAPKLIIKAGPGAGKTRVLVERVQFLVNERHVDPKSVLVITFTEKAAEELKYRLNADGDLSYEQIDQMQIGTIHGFCRTYLRNYVSSGIEVIDDQDNEKKVLFIKKHLKELGLDKYAFIPNYELKKVASKFDEYASFDVDLDKLLKHIKQQNFTKAHKVQNQRYRKFIDSRMPNEDSKFPISEVSKKQFLKSKWIAHKQLGIARAYKKYLELLDERKSYDFNLLQIKTRDSLKEIDRDKVVYKNILVDEFQDTDIIQFDIFELLSNGSETVTYVGDINQSIYGWRGAVSSNFNKLIKSGEFEVKELLTNYRSPKNIVDLTNHFMVDKMELRAHNQNNGDLYYLDSRDKGEQAKKIVGIIKRLKKDKKIEKYSDVGLLFRSTRMNHIEELLNELKAKKIKFHIQGAPDFEIYPEVECVLLLLWYLTNDMMFDMVFNLKEFANYQLNKEMFKFNDYTLEVLKNYKGSPKEFSKFSKEQLRNIGIVDEKDLNFFDKLNQLKYRFHNTYADDYTKLDLIGLYYELFEITGYIKNKLESIKKKGEDIDTNVELLNLGLISKKINDFMGTVDRFDVDGLFEFLYTFYQDYSSPSNSLDNVDCVQILTIHKSKGLEFPVVFVCSLMESVFPKRKPYNEKITDYKIPRDIKYEKVFKNKPYDMSFNDAFKIEFKKEERRILYVGLTRAKSTLIVSHLLNRERESCKEFQYMKKINPKFIELTPRNISLLDNVKTNKPEDDEYEFSFTSLENYNTCPQKYNLIHNYNFISPQNIGMRIGTIVHAVLDKINREIMDNPNHTIDIGFIERVIDEAIESNKDLEDNPMFLEMLNSVMNYYPLIGIEMVDNSTSNSGGGHSDSDGWEDDFDDEPEIIPATIEESEYPFTIPWFDARLKGSIDLIMSYGDKISLIDFKTSDEESIDEYIKKYSKQLHFYLLAMEYNSIYGPKKDITTLQVYSLKDNKFVPVEKQEDLKEDLKSSLINVAQKVKNKDYPKCVEIDKCEKCLLKSLCCR